VETVTAGFKIDLDHFRARVLQDCLTEATAGYWLHRAYEFHEAAPKPGDYRGKPPVSAETISASYARCMATALACRQHAQLILDEIPQEISPEVLAVLNELD
jgi:hypothetical protein